jgi:serine/threonine-protein kinase
VSYPGNTPPLSSRLRPDGIIAGRYQLTRRLAAGGFGVVYLAHHLMLECEVVVKLMSDDLSDCPDSAARFEREARGAARLGTLTDHAVRIMDYGIDGGVPYIVMERLHGESLGERLGRVTRLAPADSVRVTRQIARALSKAQNLGLVHRDVKPENVFLTVRDEQEKAVLLDFGALKDLGPSRVAQWTQPIGTLPYMSPEAVQGLDIDCRADLWSLAVVVYRMVVGALPFEAKSIGELVRKICHEAPPRPSRAAPHLADLDAFFVRAFDREIDERFQSAEELARAFAAALGISWPPSASSLPAPSIPPPPLLPALPAPAPSGEVLAPTAVDSDAATLRSLV